jgi:hypothetical protein
MFRAVEVVNDALMRESSGIDAQQACAGPESIREQGR